MDLAGEFTFDGPQDIVWDAVRDPDVLGSVLPGGEGITEIAENEYEGKLKMKVGPVQGKFKGNVKLLNIDAPTGYDIEVNGKGAPGFVKASGNLKLTGDGEKTHMVYSGNARVGGKMASVGQRLLEASTKAIVNQSLVALNEYIKVQVQRRDGVEVVSAETSTPEAETTTVVTETVTVEATAAPKAAPRPTYTAPPPKMPEYKPPSQTELMLNVTAEILDDLVPKTLQPIVLSVATTLITMFIVKLFSRKK